jgi:hypothetical protein
MRRETTQLLFFIEYFFVWDCFAVEVEEQKVWICTEAPLPLFQERQPNKAKVGNEVREGEVMETSHHTKPAFCKYFFKPRPLQI